MNWYFFVITLITLLVLACTVEIDANSTVCVPLNKPKGNSKEEGYSNLIRTLKLKLTSKLEDDNSTKYYEHLEFQFQHPAISAQGELNKVNVSNLNDRTIKYFQHPDIIHNKMELFNLTFHNMSIKGDYNLTGNIGDLFDIFGAGDFWLNLQNLSISAMSNFPTINKTAACITMDIKPQIQNVEGWFNHLMNDDDVEEVINHTIMELIPEALDVIWDEFKDDLDEALQKLIQSIIDEGLSEMLLKIEKLRQNVN